MQCVSNIRTTYGLPLCLAGVSRHHHLSRSKEIADHDRRREELKRSKSENRSLFPADENEINGEVREIDVVLRSSDLVIFNLNGDDQSSVRHTPCTAKAA